MHSTIRKLLSGALLLLSVSTLYSQGEIRPLLEELDRTIDSNQYFTAAKQCKIDMLKEKLSSAVPASVDAYEARQKLIDEYRYFQADSALKYENINIRWAKRHNDLVRRDRGYISMFRLLSIMGFYTEAIDLAGAIDRSTLADSLLTDYYYASYFLYGELMNSPDSALSRSYYDRSRAYRDSLAAAYDRDRPLPAQMNDLKLMSWALYGIGVDTDRAIATHLEFLSECEPRSHEYGQFALRIAALYGRKGDIENRIKYLTLSSIANIRSGIRDQSSINLLVNELYKQGVTDKTYRYIRFAWEQALQFNSRMRMRNIAEVLAILDKEQHDIVVGHNRRISSYNYVISTALFLLLLTLCFVYFQNRQLKTVKDKLKDANERLEGENEALNDANKLKLALVTQFMMQCSSHIKSLDSWRKMVYGKVVKGKSKELLSVSDNEELGKDLDEFYHNFDVAFLQMYPDFVKRFNDLLNEDERIVLKKDELLNPELRIFALIHLGISDSSQIAGLLHYSVNTIYNYRAKVKNKARVERDLFEEFVVRIK